MAESPKSTKKDGPTAAAKGANAETPKPAPKTPQGPVEDAEVIGETPAPVKPVPAAKTAANDKAPVEPAEPSKKVEARPAEPPKAAAGSDERPTGAETAKASKPETPKIAAPVQAAKRRGGVGSFVGLLLGGVAAAVIGFVAARTVVPEGWPFPGVAPEEDPLVSEIAAQAAEIAALEDQLAGVAATLGAVQADTSAVDGLRSEMTTRLDEIETTFGEIADRLDAVEKLAPEGSAAAEAAAAAYDRELQALREMFAGELAKVEAAQADAAGLQEQAAEAQRAAQGRAALSAVASALDTGVPFADALAEFAEASGATVPDALAAVAADGVPTLAALQAEFAPAARDAIDADIRARVEAGSMGRAQAFLQTQLGTRSLEPKAGDTADAVLSRAEAALKTGDLAAALTELAGLPEAAQPAMADWRSRAEARSGALAASAALATELNAK
ncbi:MAG: hypothetical protein KDK10_11135 [Maritimibacter sp.]|nr:hypothetical protein [Maritimibacter sp.]